MVAIDLLSVSSYVGSQPHDQFAWLREHEPVYRHDEPAGPGFWAVTRYDDLKTVGRDHERFSSSPTIMIDDPETDRSAVLGDHVMMLMADPPVHTRMRRFVSPNSHLGRRLRYGRGSPSWRRRSSIGWSSVASATWSPTSPVRCRAS